MPGEDDEPGSIHELVGVSEHMLHGLQIDALARHVRRRFVGLINLQEARALALGFGDGLFLVAFSILHDLRRPAARIGNDAIGIGLGFVLQPLEVGARRLHVAECDR